MLRRALGLALFVGYLTTTLGCGESKVENKPNFTPKETPKAADGSKDAMKTMTDAGG